MNSTVVKINDIEVDKLLAAYTKLTAYYEYHNNATKKYWRENPEAYKRNVLSRSARRHGITVEEYIARKEAGDFKSGGARKGAGRPKKETTQ
jgi:hypothetical protein